MKILIQQPASQMFLDSSFNWVEDINQAREFRSIAGALQELSSRNIIDFQVLLSFPDPRFDAVLYSHKTSVPRITLFSPQNNPFLPQK